MEGTIDSSELRRDPPRGEFREPRSLHRVMLFELFRRSGATLERACSKKRSRVLERGLFEPLRGPQTRENDPRTSVLRASSKPQGSNEGCSNLVEAPELANNYPRTSVLRASSKPQGPKRVAQVRFSSLFEQWSKQRSKRPRSSLQNHWARSDLARSELAGSSSATGEGSIDRLIDR